MIDVTQLLEDWKDDLNQAEEECRESRSIDQNSYGAGNAWGVYETLDKCIKALEEMIKEEAHG